MCISLCMFCFTSFPPTFYWYHSVPHYIDLLFNGDFQVKMVILFQKLFIIFTTEMFLHAHFRTVRERKENTDERTVQVYHNTDSQSKSNIS
jgi:hypothetical protein